MQPADYFIFFLIALVAALLVVIFQSLQAYLVRPRLDLVFSNKSPHVLQTTQSQGDQTFEARFLRVSVHNRGHSVARNCRAYVHDIVRVGPKGEETIILSRDPVGLCWSYESMHDQASYCADVPADFSRYVDVFYAISGGTQKGLNIHSIKTPERIGNYFENSGLYRADITVVSENARPVTKQIEFIYRNDWSSLQTLLNP